MLSSKNLKICVNVRIFITELIFMRFRRKLSEIPCFQWFESRDGEMRIIFGARVLVCCLLSSSRAIY